MVIKMIFFIFLMALVIIVAGYLVFQAVTCFFTRDFFGTNKNYYDHDDLY